MISEKRDIRNVVIIVLDPYIISVKLISRGSLKCYYFIFIVFYLRFNSKSNKRSCFKITTLRRKDKRIQVLSLV